MNIWDVVKANINFGATTIYDTEMHVYEKAVLTIVITRTQNKNDTKQQQHATTTKNNN
jgi:hypothetical protein